MVVVKRTSFVPGLGEKLEDRVVPTTQTLVVAAAVSLPPVGFGGGAINPTIPFVHAPRGVSQRAINFTSIDFNQVVQGVIQNFAVYNKNGNLTALETGITRVSNKIPFGLMSLNPTLFSLIKGLNSTTLDTNHAVEIKTFVDLVGYLKNGIGQKFNVLRSDVHYSTDVLLTFNDRL
jgi:hypothetical protein